MIVFIAIPSKGTVNNGALSPKFLRFFASLVRDNPHHTLISPMVQDYVLLPYMENVDATWDVWGYHCKRLIEVCDIVWVLQFEGWDTSVGVAGEIEHARVSGKRVHMVSVE